MATNHEVRGSTPLRCNFLKVVALGPFTNTSGFFETNAYVLGCDKTLQAFGVDAPQDSLEWYKHVCAHHHLTLTHLLLTHSHLDHIAEAAEIQKHFKCKILLHKADEKNLNQPGSDGLPLMFSIEKATVDEYVIEGQIIQVGDLEIHVIETPGHTPGGVCFYIPRQGILFSGDTLFKGTIGNLSFPTARVEKMWPSLHKLAKLPRNTVVYPGHGSPTTIQDEPWLSKAEEFFG